MVLSLRAQKGYISLWGDAISEKINRSRSDCRTQRCRTLFPRKLKESIFKFKKALIFNAVSGLVGEIAQAVQRGADQVARHAFLLVRKPLPPFIVHAVQAVR